MVEVQVLGDRSETKGISVSLDTKTTLEDATKKLWGLVQPPFDVGSALIQPESHRPFSFLTTMSEAAKLKPGEKVYIRDVEKVTEEIVDNITESMYGDNPLLIKKR
eukprot:1159391-Amorphochlora_amoeboformis.AAC.1